jgi:hypothetical protein
VRQAGEVDFTHVKSITEAFSVVKAKLQSMSHKLFSPPGLGVTHENRKDVG